jgi:hypothetical protein
MNKAQDPLGLDKIVEAARHQSLGGCTIIAFADSRYIDVLLNWLTALTVSGIENYLIVALDYELHAFLLERKIPVVLSAVRGDLSALWVRRIDVFAALCDAGIDFVHSDVDAVWMRDPRDSFLADPNSDLIVSQGTIWPPDVHQQFGFVLCCGFFQLRSTPSTQRLLSELRESVLVTGDDQVSLNRLIAARATRWLIEPSETYYVEGAGKNFLCSRSVMHGLDSHGLRMAVLPHHLFQRVPVPSDEEPFVLHLLTRKEPAAKLSEFERHGCLLLRADWRKIGFDANSLARLRRNASAKDRHV